MFSVTQEYLSAMRLRIIVIEYVGAHGARKLHSFELVKYDLKKAEQPSPLIEAGLPHPTVTFGSSLH